MENRNLETLAQELGLKKQQVETVLELTAEGNTIPFIARYRKEKTGNLDETQIKAIIDMDKSLTALQDRKETVLAKIEAQGKLTDQLKAAIEAAEKLADVEELYLPYKEKRRTKATIAREAGLFPLARLILQNSSNLKDEAEKLTSEAFPTADKALAGAVDILVEAFSEDNSLRSWTYNEIWNNSDEEVINQSLKKKIIPAMERRIRSELTEAAEDGAINLFSQNLRSLLLVSPLKGKMVLGFDPAFRTGAKLAVVDQTGKLITTQVIYPVAPASQAKIAQAKKDLADLIKEHAIEIIAIGNGTASRESEAFVAEVLKDFPETSYVIVNESGASVYSASELARHEFPDLTVEKRSAISIARRLQDPLAELVKIDPKSIGVGQYQHDVSQKKLSENLDFVVDTVVNQVGVNVNTASSTLLSHVSGLNKTISENIVAYREENGEFTSRDEIKKVPRLGAKAFEQAAGFLRIPNAKNILDNTGVHPESYPAVKALFKQLDITDLDDSAKAKLKALNLNDTAEELGLGQETLKDIIADLLKPGRDLRDDFEAPVLRKDVLELKDLSVGQKLEGTVRNVVDFGAFVDIGVHEDGLIHISEMSKSFVNHPSQVVSVGDLVTVWVSKIDLEHEKLNLSLVNPRESN